MYTFYVKNIETEIAQLDEPDSAHCMRVLRMNKGDTVYLVDGQGGFYEGEVSDYFSRHVTVKIKRIRKEYGRRNYFLHVAIAPTKSIDRFEWFLEKATEIGIDQITPILCERSERKTIRHERLDKILISAIKQSVQAYLPLLNPLTKFESFLNQCNTGHRYIAHCRMDGKLHLIKVDNPSGQFTILIGPEGDFSDQEVLSAENRNFVPVSLGQNRLRTETAGVVACQLISDWNTLRSGR
jgi:16S rRNA (uracil1498-N3)-methyltransferase